MVLEASRFMAAVEETPEGHKTQVWVVVSRRNADPLGTIKWWGAWRQYTFQPEPGTVFNAGCLSDIQDALGLLMDERKAPLGEVEESG